MRLIKEIESRRDNKDRLSKWGEFYCEHCKHVVERQLSNGYRDKSCGCMRGKLIAEAEFKHGESHTKLYKIWGHIKSRCNNPNFKQYKDYGGRGITICPEWTNDYTVFRDWALSNGYQEGLEIDRRDNDGNYEPSNCRFVTKQRNAQNRRNNVIKSIEIANEIRELHKTDKYIQKELAEKYDVSQVIISYIINNKIWRNNAN